MKIWNEIWDYVKMIIIVVVVVLVINNVVLINAKIPSESMENTIMTYPKNGKIRNALTS